MNYSELCVWVGDFGLTEKDCVLVTRYGGKGWEANWLEVCAHTYAWHIDVANKLDSIREELDTISVRDFMKKYNSYLDYLEIGLAPYYSNLLVAIKSCPHK